MRLSIPKNPRIVLLADSAVGLKIAFYLARRRENIIGLVLHPRDSAKLGADIKRAVRVAKKNIFFANQLNDPKVLSRVKALNPDMAICAWFGYILKRDFINLFPSGVLNVHNSYLPYNRGKYPHVWAICNGLPYGITIHFIDEGIDTGDIIFRKKMRIYSIEVAGDVYDRSLKEAAEFFIKKWPAIKANRFRAIKQNHSLAIHHFSCDAEKLDFIDTKKRYLASDLINRLRARSFKDRSYAYFMLGGKKIYVKISLLEDMNFQK